MKKSVLKAIVMAVVSLAGFTAASAMAQGKVEVQWLGQAAFKITTPGGKVIVTDPWLINNPITPAQYKDLDALGKIDVLLVTHGHGDHIADAPALARKHNIPVWLPGDLAQTLTTLGVLPAAQLPRFNKGGRVTPAPGIQVTAVRAEHSSVYVWTNPATTKPETHPGGEPIGYIIQLENGFKIWHMGDTGMFPDMQFIADYYKPDLVLAPIGGNFTMDPVGAAYVTKNWIKPRFVTPIHYNSNPIAKGTLAEFQAAMQGAPSGITVMPMTEGQTLSY